MLYVEGKQANDAYAGHRGTTARREFSLQSLQDPPSLWRVAICADKAFAPQLQGPS
jgi:hypothetical protein